MEQTIYGDIYFLVNFSMDFLSLWLTAKILHLPLRTLKATLSAAIGGVYAVLALIPGRYAAVNWFIGLLLPALLCYICFGSCKIGRFLGRYAIFWGISLLTGGGMTALYYGINRIWGNRQIAVNGTVKEVYNEIPLWVFALLALICALISLIWGRIAGRMRSRGSAILTVICMKGGQEVTLSALVDSGNLLTEPFGGLPVILVGRERMKEILPAKLHPVLMGNGDLSELDRDSASRIRLIPYRGVGGGGLMFGYLPAKVAVDGREVAACLAVEPGVRDFSGYEAIVPSCL